MAITDKMVKRAKKCLLSVNFHHNGQKFTDKSLKNAGLSVKCVLLTDKSSKMAALSVNLDEILAELAEQPAFKKMPNKVNRTVPVFLHKKNQHPHVADTGQKLIRFRFPASDQEDQAKRNGGFDDDHESAPCNLCSSEPDV